jgi:membrane-bound lytic murein transglycosylase D
LTCAALATALAGCESFGLRAGASASTSPSFAVPANAMLGAPLSASFIDARASRAAGVPGALGLRDASSLSGTAGASSASSASSARVDTGIDVLVRPEIVLESLPVRPGDLVQRLRDSFSLTAADDAAYKRELQYFASHPEYVERVVTRSSPYLYYIADQIYRRGMPAELALLPIVESAFDPFAYSRGRAAGLWQIIPGTARRLGVQQTWWFDGRRDLLQSTQAALDYLEELHQQFSGDWLLAIAGYNSGEGNVARALASARAAGRSTDFWGIRPYLPKETRTYVPRLLAICSLLANPERYELELPVLPDKPELAVVETGGQIDMSLAAKLAGVDTDELYRLNPGVNRWATDPSGPHRLVVPVASAEAFRANLAALGDRERVEWTRYKIASGDTLIELADRFRTTPAVLREANRLSGNTIRVGDYLMIPHAVESLEAYSQTVTARAARVQQREHAGERRVHIVRGGESLWSIAQHYGVTVAALAQWNAMAPRDPLSVGRKLVIWTPAAREPRPQSAQGAQTQTLPAREAQLQPEREPQAQPGLEAQQAREREPAAAVATVASERSMPAGDRIRRVNYVVRGGDSLSAIATRFRISVGQLVEWNDGLSTDDYLRPGQHLVMFVNIAEQST